MQSLLLLCGGGLIEATLISSCSRRRTATALKFTMPFFKKNCILVLHGVIHFLLFAINILQALVSNVTNILRPNDVLSILKTNENVRMQNAKMQGVESS